MKPSVFTSRIQSILRDNSFDRVVQRQRRGKLDTKGLYRYQMNSKVFKRKMERMNKKYDCTILVDCSGSMETNVGVGSLTRYNVAVDGAVALHKALVAARIPTRVRAFNTILKTMYPTVDRKIPDSEYEEVMRDNFDKIFLSKRHHSHSGLHYPQFNNDSILCDGDSPLYGKFYDCMQDYYKYPAQRKGGDLIDHVRNSIPELKRITYIDSGPGHNIDPIALTWAIKKAEEESGRDSKHIVIVVSDGQPAIYDRQKISPDGSFSLHMMDSYKCSMDYDRTVGFNPFSLRDVVNQSLKDGILFIGIGIGSDSVLRYYPEEFCTVIGVRSAHLKNKNSLSISKKNADSVLFDAVSSQLRKHIRIG